MNKKIILAAIVFFIISTLSIFCFAEASNNTNTSNTVDLKGEITKSLDKTRNTAGNVTNGVVSGAESVMNTVTNGINDIIHINFLFTFFISYYLQTVQPTKLNLERLWY